MNRVSIGSVQPFPPITGVDFSQRLAKNPTPRIGANGAGQAELAGGLFDPEFAAEGLASLDTAADGFEFRISQRSIHDTSPIRPVQKR